MKKNLTKFIKSTWSLLYSYPKTNIEYYSTNTRYNFLGDEIPKKECIYKLDKDSLFIKVLCGAYMGTFPLVLGLQALEKVVDSNSNIINYSLGATISLILNGSSALDLLRKNRKELELMLQGEELLNKGKKEYYR